MGLNAFRLMEDKESIPFIVDKMKELKEHMEKTIRREKKLNRQKVQEPQKKDFQEMLKTLKHSPVRSLQRSSTYNSLNAKICKNPALHAKMLDLKSVWSLQNPQQSSSSQGKQGLKIERVRREPLPLLSESSLRFKREKEAAVKAVLGAKNSEQLLETLKRQRLASDLLAGLDLDLMRKKK